MKKTLRLVLTLLLVVMMTFGVIAPVVAYAQDGNNGSPDSSYDAGWLQLERFGDELVVTLTPDVDSLKEIDKAQIKAILDEVLDFAKDVVISSLKDDIFNGQYADGKDGFTDLESVWSTAIDGYLGQCGFESGDYVGFFKEAVNDETLIDGLVDYACGLLITAHKAGIVDDETLESFDVEAAIDEAFNTKVSELIAEHKQSNLNAYVAYIFGEGAASEVDPSVLAFANGEVADYVYDVAYNAYYETGLVGDSDIETAIEAFVVLGREEGKALADIITRDNAVSTLCDIISEITDAGVKASIRATVTDKVSVNDGYSDEVYLAVVGLTEAQFEAKLDEYVDKMVAGYDETVADLSRIDTSITITDVIGYVDEVKVNGIVLYGTKAEGRGTELKFDNVLKLLAKLPNFYDISKMANDEMKYSFDVSIGTTLGSDCEFTLTGKIGGGYDEVRKIAELLSKYINAGFKNGELVLDVQVPAVVSKALLKAANSDGIDPVLKHKVFSAFMADGNDVYALIKELTFEDLITLLECVNLEGILDKEFVKQFVDLSDYTNEEIIEIVKRYEKYFNVALKYGVRLADKVVNYIPEKYMNYSILDIINYEDKNDKFSYSDGLFEYEGTHTISYELIEKAASKAAGLVGIDDSLVSFVLGLIPEKYQQNGFTLSADLSLDFVGLNRVDYVVDGEVIRSGFLPKGADVDFFAKANDSEIVCWIDEDLKVVTKMPDRDVVLTAVYNDGKAYPTEDVDKVYDGKSETVGVTIGDTTRTFTYEWYKDGELLSVTSETFQVVNVKDSGVYTYKVYHNGMLTHEGEIKVAIAPAKIDTSKISIVEDFFEYDAQAHTVEIAGVPAGVLATLGGDVTATDIGNYKLSVSLAAENENYVVDPAELSFEWSIKRVIDVSDLFWSWPVDENDPDNVTIPVYNGKEFEVTLGGDELDKLVVTLTGNKATDAGDYIAKILSVELKAEYKDEYVLVGLDALPELEWTIDPKSVDVSDVVWGTDISFTYDGNVHGVYVENCPVGLVPQYTANEATDAGKYVASVTFVPAPGYENNYEALGEVADLEWTIAPKEFDVSTLVWSSFAGFVYNAEAHEVEITNLPAFIEVKSLNGASAINAGNYTATAELASTDTNYTLSASTVTYNWSVAKATVTVSGINWNYVTGSIIYNGAEQKVQAPAFALDIEALREFITVTVAGNAGTNAGSYQATVAFECTNGNFAVAVADGEPTVLNWGIAPLSVDVSALTWNYSTPFTYNGQLQGVTLNSVPAGIVITYSDNSFTNAGSYTATAAATAENGNYTVAGTVPSLDWAIAKAAIDGSSIKLENATVTYDGTEHSITVTGNADVLAMLDVTYEGNGKVLLGQYTVTATLTVKDEYAANYTYSDELTATLTITGDKKTDHEIKDGNDVIVKVEAENGLDPDNIIAGGVTTDVESTYDVDGDEAEVLVAYDIYFTEGGAVVSVDGQTFTVRLLIPLEYRSLDADELRVIHIKDDGSVEIMDATREGDYMVFDTTHFSVYAIVRIEGPNLIWLWILLALILIAGIVIGVYFLLRSRQDRAVAPDEIPEVVAEAPAEEPVAEEEPVVEEEPVIEEVEEIPEVEEIVEEAEEEEIPAVEEEIVEAEEEPVVEETPAPELPKTAMLVMGEDGKEATAIIGGEVVHIRFRSSFMSRLIQSTENIQDFYTTIKNHVLSYKGIKARESWNYEAFNKGRIQLVKLNIKGRTLIVNLNLDPKEFNINKYHFIDCSDKPKFAKVPMMMKVRSGRALKYTLELIDEMMAKYELTQGEVPTVDYRMAYETTEELAKRGLVKVILPAGVTLSDDMTFVHVNVSELIESGTSEKTTEQLISVEAPETDEVEIDETPEVVEEPIEETPIEETPIEETPVEEAPVEEAPVEEAPVEEAPVEEAPVVEEPVVEEPVEEATVVEEPVEEAPVVEEPKAPTVQIFEDGTVYADAVVADQLVTDEEAESKIEIVTVEAARRAGKMGEINLDVICENFEDDEVVDVEALKAKRLVSPKIARVKVLARGIMYKRLTVKASKFSLQAVKMITLAGGKVELEE
ncbi:MAG: uL15 family ribosomal protein [Clostridia bacterium]|nr:uL15 family ribosomal protein [Clostridia bacterium]